MNVMLGRRIAIFQPALHASMGIASHEDLVAALRRLGHEVQLVSTSSASPADPLPCRVLPEPRWTSGLVAEIGAPFFRTRWLVGAAAALTRYLRRSGGEIDVIYTLIAYPQATAAALAIAWSGWRGRLVVMPGGEDLNVAEEAGFGFRRFPVPRHMVGWTLRRADGICCQSPSLRAIAESYRPKGILRDFPDNVADAVVRFAEAPAREHEERRRRARANVDRELGTAGAPLLLALGRLHPVKGYDRLIDLLPELPHYRLVIAGPSIEMRGYGDVATALRARAVQRGVVERVTFTGQVPREKSYELLAAADVLAAPSHCEGMPKTAVEAAALGTPFVLTDTCGIAAEPHGETLGRVARHWDARAFAAALAAARDLRPDRDEARAFVRRFSPERIAGELAALLDALSPSTRSR